MNRQELLEAVKQFVLGHIWDNVDPAPTKVINLLNDGDYEVTLAVKRGKIAYWDVADVIGVVEHRDDSRLSLAEAAAKYDLRDYTD